MKAFLSLFQRTLQAGRSQVEEGPQMTQHIYERKRGQFKDIVAADEARTGILRQIVKGVGGLLLLLAAGLVIVLLVLWRSP